MFWPREERVDSHFPRHARLQGKRRSEPDPSPCSPGHALLRAWHQGQDGSAIFLKGQRSSTNDSVFMSGEHLFAGEGPELEEEEEEVFQDQAKGSSSPELGEAEDAKEQRPCSTENGLPRVSHSTLPAASEQPLPEEA